MENTTVKKMKIGQHTYVKVMNERLDWHNFLIHCVDSLTTDLD